MTKVVVAIPWRETPERIEGFTATVHRWRSLLGADVEIVDVDTDHHPYNLSAARNVGVQEADQAGADVVVISDADCVLADDVQIHQVIRAAADGGLHLPFTAQAYLDKLETIRVFKGDYRSRPGRHGNGACYVVRPEVWWEFGGGDERFSGWGGDDDGTVAAASCLVGLRRHSGTVLSLWHADECRPIGTKAHRPNAVLANRYWAVIDDPVAMRALIAERSTG